MMSLALAKKNIVLFNLIKNNNTIITEYNKNIKSKKFSIIINRHKIKK